MLLMEVPGRELFLYPLEKYKLMQSVCTCTSGRCRCQAVKLPCPMSCVQIIYDSMHMIGWSPSNAQDVVFDIK